MCQWHKLGILLHNANILYCFISTIYYKQNISQLTYIYFLVSEMLLASFVNKYYNNELYSELVDGNCIRYLVN